jgi:uncharacterized protein YkwD
MRSRMAVGMAGLSLASCWLASPLEAQNMAPGFKEDPLKIETEVMKTFNFARSNPKGYVDLLRAYRGFFHANVVSVPGSNTDFETEEGIVPVDEAINFLDRLPAQAPLETGDSLRQAAIDHVKEQGATGRTGHFGADGSGPVERNMRHGGGNQVAEVIAYGAADAEDVIRQLIVDDGVRDRGHRVLMFMDHLRYAGVACGPHPEFGTMCVIDMADTVDGKPGSKVQVAKR